MKSILLLKSVIFLLLMVPLHLAATGEFKPVNRWNHGDKGLYTQIDDVFIDNNGDVVMMLEKSQQSCRLITPTDVKAFAPIGQGPSDVYQVLAICRYNNDIAFLQLAMNVKVFTKRDGTFEWKQTRWLKRAYYPYFTRNVLYYKDKLFLAGYHPIKSVDKRDTVSLLQVYGSDNKQTSDLILREYNSANRNYIKDYYIAPNGDQLLFLAEDIPEVHKIDLAQLKVLEKIQLEVPEFYKKMPDDFYRFKQYGNDSKGFLRDISTWKSSYSRIVRAAVEDNLLVLQIRTCSNNHKKFAVLFYSVKDFKLQRVFFIDDYFLGARDGKYYFYAGGNPGLDEGTDECIINIYAFAGKK